MRRVFSPTEILARAEQEGIDLSMLRERLRLTPTQRLERHQAALALVEALRDAKRKGSRGTDRAIAGRPLQG